MSFRVNLYLISDMAPVSSKDFLGIQATIECRFTLKLIRDIIITYSENSLESLKIVHTFFLTYPCSLPLALKNIIVKNRTINQIVDKFHILNKFADIDLSYFLSYRSFL